MDNRSWWVGLLPPLLGLPILVLIAGMIWASKPSEQRIKIYNSVEACRAEQPAEDCAKAFAGAEQEHAETAPRLAAREVCEAQYGNCAALHDGTGDWFIPAMAEFMLGHAVGTGGAASVVSRPVYVDRGGAAYSGASPIGSYRTRCAVNLDDPYCRRSGGSGGGGGFVYASSGGGGGSSSSPSSVWSSKSYTRRIGEDVGDARRFWKQRVLGAAIFDGRGERAERDLVIVRDARRVRDHRFLAQCGKLTWSG